jgi:hypothetical protein
MIHLRSSNVVLNRHLLCRVCLRHLLLSKLGWCWVAFTYQVQE